MGQVRVGFLGFGEVAYHFGRGLAFRGLANIVAYSPSGAKAARGDAITQRAADAGVTLVATPRQLCERSDVIFGVVPGRAALPALRSIRAHLRPGQLYADATTAGVATMERGERLVDGRALYVDAAIMGSVPLDGIETPVVVSGPGAARFETLLAPHGMRVKVLPGRAGAATAMKLIRSVCMKGLAGVLLEACEAAHRHGILDEVAENIAVSMDEHPFAHTIKRYVCGTAVHAERRVHEMTEALALLRAGGSSSRMTRATRAKLLDVVELGLRERCGGQEPDSIHPVIEALVAARR